MFCFISFFTLNLFRRNGVFVCLLDQVSLTSTQVLYFPESIFPITHDSNLQAISILMPFYISEFNS